MEAVNLGSYGVRWIYIYIYIWNFGGNCKSRQQQAGRTSEFLAWVKQSTGLVVCSVSNYRKEESFVVSYIFLILLKVKKEKKSSFWSIQNGISWLLHVVWATLIADVCWIIEVVAAEVCADTSKHSVAGQGNSCSQWGMWQLCLNSLYKVISHSLKQLNYFQQMKIVCIKLY